MVDNFKRRYLCALNNIISFKEGCSIIIDYCIYKDEDFLNTVLEKSILDGTFSSSHYWTQCNVCSRKTYIYIFDDKKDAFCLSCNQFVYCYDAQKDIDICLLHKCTYCKVNTCRHGLHSSGLCLFCANLLKESYMNKRCIL